MPDPARRNERSRLAILTAAQELLTEVGYAALTIEAIAARAGVGKQTIYRWWPGRGAVILDALTVSAAEQKLPDTGDVHADLRVVMRATVAEFADPRLSATTRALTIETLSNETLAAQVRDRLLEPQMAAIRSRLAAGQEAGQIRAGVDLGVAAELFMGPLYHRWMLGTGPLTEAYADDLVDLAMAGLTPAPGGPR
jgi:AcrR family transcriptional regulator